MLAAAAGGNGRVLQAAGRVPSRLETLHVRDRVAQRGHRGLNRFVPGYATKSGNQPRWTN
jgi:hypothetical protein